MAIVGGFLAAYAILNRGGVLGNSQTMNLLSLLFSVIGRNLIEFLIHLAAVIVYISGISLTVIIMRKTKIDIIIFSIVIDFIAVFLIGLIPSDINNVIALYPIFFAMAIQWTSFKSVDGYISSSIFSTNNLKQTAISITEYLIDKDKSNSDRAVFFLTVLLSFHIGAAISYFSHELFGIKGAWVCFIPLLLAACLYSLKQRSDRRVKTAQAL